MQNLAAPNISVTYIILLNIQLKINSTTAIICIKHEQVLRVSCLVNDHSLREFPGKVAFSYNLREKPRDQQLSRIATQK